MRGEEGDKNKKSEIKTKKKEIKTTILFSFMNGLGVQ